MRRNGIFALVVDYVADIHADEAAVFQHPVALGKDNLHVLQVFIEVVGGVCAVVAAAHVKIGRVCYHELHGAVRHFSHSARVADYNKVFVCHAHIDWAGYDYGSCTIGHYCTSYIRFGLT